MSDVGNNTVQKFDSRGRFIIKLKGPFRSPDHIAVDSANKWVYVADKDTRIVFKYDSFGRLLSEIGIP